LSRFDEESVLVVGVKLSEVESRSKATFLFFEGFMVGVSGSGFESAFRGRP
jgi:hypothetical protein